MQRACVGVKVILVDANHCPGAVQFLFELPNGEKYIHCGDMRFGPHLLQNPNLKYFQDANAVFLDTTYCNPKYTFPPQVNCHINPWPCCGGTVGMLLV